MFVDFVDLPLRGNSNQYGTLPGLQVEIMATSAKMVYILERNQQYNIVLKKVVKRKKNEDRDKQQL